MNRTGLWVRLAGIVTMLMAAMLIGVVPMAQPVTSESPRLSNRNRVRLDYGFVVLHQTFMLPKPTPLELAVRLWVQRLPNTPSYIRIRGAAGSAIFGPVSPVLAPADGQFHMVQLPWWKLPSASDKFSLAVEGNGVLVMTTPTDQVGGGNLKINGVLQPQQYLALQFMTYSGGIERYLPVARIAKGRPGVLGSPYMLLYVGALYIMVLGLLLGSCRALVSLLAREFSEDMRP